MNKLKNQLEDISNRIKALEERADNTETKTGDHDKEFIKVWEALDGKADMKDLEKLVKELQKLANALNEL